MGNNRKSSEARSSEGSLPGSVQGSSKELPGDRSFVQESSSVDWHTPSSVMNANAKSASIDSRLSASGDGSPERARPKEEAIRIKKRPSRNAQILDSWTGIEVAETPKLMDNEEQV